MRDLVLLHFVHLGITRVVSNGLEAAMVSETYVLPSYSNIGSHPVESQHVKRTAGLGPYQNSLDLLLVLSCPW
jgi:hypothetical protein